MRSGSPSIMTQIVEAPSGETETTSTSVQRTTLKDDWEFSQVSSASWPDVDESWRACSIPTSVHVELQKAGKIPNFHKGLNEWEVQCEWMSGRSNSRDPRGRLGLQDDVQCDGG